MVRGGEKEVTLAVAVGERQHPQLREAAAVVQQHGVGGVGPCRQCNAESAASQIGGDGQGLGAVRDGFRFRVSGSSFGFRIVWGLGVRPGCGARGSRNGASRSSRRPDAAS